MDLMYYFDQLLPPGNKKERNKTHRAPFSYMGSKYKSLEHVLPHLPMRKGYIEVFGGSGVVLLNRPPTKLDVFNDLHSGIAAFYKCMQDEDKYNLLINKLEMTVHSREFWNWCRDTWEGEESDVDRAFKWFYTIRLSFGHLGRNFARVVKGENMESQRIFKSMPLFKFAHERFRDVIVENRDCMLLLEEYDNTDHVFYLDPPYIDCWHGSYKHDQHLEDHKRMLDYIFKMKSYIAISGYDHTLYDDYPWDDIHSWKGSQCTDPGYVRSKKDVTEILWIKKERT
jgi:DNA adenine methylase